MTEVFLEAPRRLVDVTIDGEAVRVPEGATLLDACRQQGIDTPTLCYLENLTPVNVCRVCVVEVRNGSGELVPAAPRPWLARQIPNDRPDVPSQLNSPAKLDTSMPLALPATAFTPRRPCRPLRSAVIVA
jgi:ferredoxin